MGWTRLNISGVVIMLNVTIFATIMADMLPVSNNTPLIGQHLANNSTLVVPHPIPTPTLSQCLYKSTTPATKMCKFRHFKTPDPFVCHA